MAAAGILKRSFIFAVLFLVSVYSPFAAADFQITLEQGWNLISLPQQPGSTEISQVTGSIAGKFKSLWTYREGHWYVYDPANPDFSDLPSMSAGIGYWINMTEPAVLSGDGTDLAEVIPLNNGWNLVGVTFGAKKNMTDAMTSFEFGEKNLRSVWEYRGNKWRVHNPGNPDFSDLDGLEPGYGYWINASDTDTVIFPPAEDYTEEINGVSFDMVYIPGGSFTLGCEGSTCPPETDPVPGVTVSSYHIAKNQVTAALWEAVTGESMGGMISITWYDAMRFACELSLQTGKAYRMMTEAEFEYAAKNYLSSLDDIGENAMGGEEWAYNSWELTHTGGTDPVGPNSGKHTQKTRRDIQGSEDYITGRLIRSIDGIGPQLRLVVSNEMEFPPDYVPPCELLPPVPPEEPENSYRDPRWITGSNTHWTEGAIKIGNFDLRAWEDGTAVLNGVSGQWFTSNNIAFVFVPVSGSIKKYAYIWLDETQGSLISDAGFNGGYTGRIEKISESGTKPVISGLKSGALLAAEAGDDYKMVDMENIPESAKKQDQRLIDGPGQGWFQDNSSVGGLHHYRKDVDADEFRFTVNQGQMTMLANGSWFTVNNTFLRITHRGGYTTDYLYTISPGGTFFHNSYQAYERADFRMFSKKSNSDTFPSSCGSHCSQEIPKNEGPSIYAILGSGESTYVPAPCPAGGCE